MNRRRSHKENKSSSDWQNNRFACNDEIEEAKKLDSLDSISILNKHLTDSFNNQKRTLPQATIGFWLRYSSWFNFFGRGLFWGGIVGCTVVLSASCGVALTKIDAVEKIIARTIERDSSSFQSFVTRDLDRPINVLLLETKSENEAIIQSSQGVGQSQRLLRRKTTDACGEPNRLCPKGLASRRALTIGQTILLLQFEPQLNTAKIINIPVDSRVEIPGFGWGTMNEAYKYGGTPLVSQSVARLLDDITIDRYVKATTTTFNRLIDSGNITLNDCDNRIDDCEDIAKQINRQETATEIIRQRLNISVYYENFKSILVETQSNLDTNLSLPETMSIANFVKELESDEIAVDLISGYTKGKSVNLNNRLHKSDFNNANPTFVKSKLKSGRTFKMPIAVQNTTDSPELGLRFVSYLRRLNFQDVYLVKHIPLKLDKTKIYGDRSQLSRAKQLKNIMGFGRLELKLDPKQKPLTIQIGEDARYLF